MVNCMSVKPLPKVSTGDGHDRLILHTPKTRSSQRTVHLLPHTLDEIREWQAAQPKRRTDDLIFGDEHGRPINDHRLRRAHKKAAAAIGRPELLTGHTPTGLASQSAQHRFGPMNGSRRRRNLAAARCES